MTLGRGRILAVLQASAICAISAICLISTAAQASERKGTFTEEFHKVYPLSSQGRIQIENINGAVHITGWNRDESKWTR